MDKEAIMARIAKLIAKAKGTTNENEAAIFMAKAAEMLAEHNLTEAMLRAREAGKDDPFVHGQYANPRGATAWPWHGRMMNALSKAYFCQCVRDQKGKFNFFGREANVAVANHMAEYLIRTILRMAREYTADLTTQEDFKRGAVSRMAERLLEIYKSQAGPENLPVVVDNPNNLPALYSTELALARDFAQGFYGGLKKGKGRLILKGEGALAGRAAAERISLNKQVAETRTSRLLS